jgi:hypothetical protein
LGRAAIPYIAPFIAFIAVMGVERLVNLSPQYLYPVRYAVVLAVVLVFSRPLVSFRASKPVWSILLGLAVFAIWVAPDLLLGYRGHWLFQNALTGEAVSSLPGEARGNWGFLAIRVLGSTLLVPIVEELFWRGWLMRWFIKTDFATVPLGAWSPSAFCLVAVLFASEHGPYWEVGLAAGVLYNWWMVRTRTLADCILAHAVTNGALSAWVIATGMWQYWL